jgi:metallo-beta-lactamase family protein
MTLRIEFLGASDTVTGSRTLVTFGASRWLIDCGLFQGDRETRARNWLPFAPSPKELSGVILTHAHLDHSGYLPRLCREGFRGPVHATDGTVDLTRILLLDAAHLEEEGAAFANKTRYSRHYPAQPLFTVADAETALGRLEAHARDVWVPLAPGLSFRFLRAGHIIGASFVQLACELGAVGTRIVTFSGDVGNGRSLHLRPPEALPPSDVLILESTYGDRLQPRDDAVAALAEIARRTFARGGVLVVPAFAVGRAQEVTYMLRLAEERGLVPRVPVILDSPMATQAMEICLAHPEDQILDSAFAGGEDPLRPARFEVARTPDESMLACMRDGPLVVISASGMLSGGRILHHLKARLPDARNTVLFSGFQAEGSKGRFLQDHAATGATLRLFHEEVPIEAEVVTLHHLSSHADREDLVAWLRRAPTRPRRIVVNHGSPDAQRALAATLRETFDVDARAAADTPGIDL